MLTIVLLLLRGMGKQYRSFRDDQAWSQNYATAAIDALNEFSTTIIQNQKTILETIQDAHKASDEKIITAICEMSSDSNKATGALTLALAGKENRTVEATERLLIGLREDLAQVRATPPVGSTGSQVKDGGTT
jgi:hypothetical protein